MTQVANNTIQYRDAQGVVCSLVPEDEVSRLVDTGDLQMGVNDTGEEIFWFTSLGKARMVLMLGIMGVSGLSVNDLLQSLLSNL